MKKFCNCYSFVLRQKKISYVNNLEIQTIKLGYFYTHKKDAQKRLTLLKKILGDCVDVQIICQKLYIQETPKLK